MVKSGSVQGKLREEIVRLVYDVAVHNTKDIDNLITRNERLKTSYKEIARVMNTEIAKIRKAGGGNLGLGPDGKISYTNVKSIAGKAGAPLLTKKTMPKAMGMEREGDLIERFGGVERFKALQSAAKYMNTELMQTPSVLGKVGVEIDKYGTPWRGQVKLTGKAFPKAMDRAIQANKGFRGELLSMMFFGMSMNKMFGSLTKGAMDMAGGTSFLSEAITVSMLPAAMSLNETFIEIGKWIIEHSDDEIVLGVTTGELTGWTAMMGQYGGQAIMVTAQLGLAADALEKLKLGEKFGATIGAIPMGSMILGAMLALAIVNHPDFEKFFTAVGKKMGELIGAAMQIALFKKMINTFANIASGVGKVASNLGSAPATGSGMSGFGMGIGLTFDALGEMLKGLQFAKNYKPGPTPTFPNQKQSVFGPVRDEPTQFNIENINITGDMTTESGMRTIADKLLSIMRLDFGMEGVEVD